MEGGNEEGVRKWGHEEGVDWIGEWRIRTKL